MVVVNAAKIQVTGNKLNDKLYYRHSGYPGGFARGPSARCSSAGPRRSSARRSRGCFPATASPASSCSKLKVYAGPEHPHEAQKPQPMEVEA